MTATGLSATPKEYRERLDDQPDKQIDAWSVELMRDTAIRVGVRKVITDLHRAFGTDDAGLSRIYTAGGGPSAVIGTTDHGELMVPGISLQYFVTGARAVLTDPRGGLIDFLVANFDELIYI